MKASRHRLVTLSITTALSFTFLTVANGDDLYHFVKEIHIGGKGGWDLLTVDPAARRLYVSHATKVVVIDLNKDAVVGEIADTPGVHGIAIASELARAFTSNGRESKASIVDLDGLKTLMKVKTGQDPDAILYESRHNEVYTFDGQGNSATVFDGASGKVITKIELPGKPEFAVCDNDAGRVYNNIEDKSEVVVIDTATHEISDTWPIAPGEKATGMAFDQAHHRLFIGCGNKKLVMMDSLDGTIIADAPIGAEVDANVFDESTQYIFSSNGEGTVTIVHEDSPDKLTIVQTLKTVPGAKTMALDPLTHRIFLPTANSASLDTSSKRANTTTGNFKVLVFGMTDGAGTPQSQ